MNHDVVAIGASAGGIEVLLELVRDLPVDLAAALFVVVHTSPDRPSELPDLLSARGTLPARHPVHGERIEPRTIYVAPPDNHIQLRPGGIEVVRGPRENGFRPAVDILFRTASVAYGPRVIGVVLSGYRDCGTVGMMSIKARGGLGVVQAPETAFAPDMPRSVLAQVAVDHVVHPRELASLVARLVESPAPPRGEPGAFVRQLEGTELGSRAELVCPICAGVLTEAHPGAFQHFRCHVGHAFSLESLVREQGVELERVLWSAVRALQESAALERRISAHSQGDLRQRFAERATAHDQEAAFLRTLLLHGGLLAAADGERTHSG